MGTDTRRDEKYFSSVPNLLQGLVEHYARRRLARSSPLASLEDLVSEVRDATRAALELCREALEKGGLEEHIRRNEGRDEPPTTRKPSLVESTPFRAFGKEIPPLPERTAS
jgi:hypothetical protein